MRSAMALAPAHHGDSAEGGMPVYERISLAFRMADGCDAQRCLMRAMRWIESCERQPA